MAYQGALKKGSIATSIGSSTTSEVSNEYNPVFFEEISKIMRGYGDADKPLRESVIMIEKIVLQQLRGIMYEAVEHAVTTRGVAEPSLKDFEYLMRTNSVKIARLQKHIKDAIFYRKRLKQLYGEQIQDFKFPFLDGSDDEFELDAPEKFDEEKTRRIFRADRISQILSGSQYEEYNLARKTSFLHKNSNTLRNRMKIWLNLSPEISVTSSCLTILSYLAHETIATLVDYCILTRLDSSNRIVDPYSRVTSSGTSYTMLHICPEITQGRGLDGVKAVTPQEINEAMRRHRQATTNPLGNFRSLAMNHKTPYLAL